MFAYQFNSLSTTRVPNQLRQQLGRFGAAASHDVCLAQLALKTRSYSCAEYNPISFRTRIELLLMLPSKQYAEKYTHRHQLLGQRDQPVTLVNS